MTEPFTTLPLRPELLEALAHIGYEQMTPIQAGTLPRTLVGGDVVGQAKTGSGKTAAFGLALLQSIEARPVVQALVLCPTRELAAQVTAELQRLAQRLPNVQVLTITGGTPVRTQAQSLAGGAHVVVGTPGRVGDHVERGNLSLAHVRTVVLDEADRMLQMGFIEQVTQITRACPRPRQTLLFSATFPDEIERLSKRVQSAPEVVKVETRVAPERLRQQLYECAPAARQQTIVDLLGSHRPSAALVFCETRADCAELAARLAREGADALALHGDMEQRDRDDVLLQFAHGSARVLVATNVAARGLDIPDMPLVIIAELSRDPEDHVHRIGRTGRAGESGLAISVVAGGPEGRRLARVEDHLGRALAPGPAVPRATRLDHLSAPNRTLLLLAGRKAKLRKGDVLGALIKDGGIPNDAIGRIDLMPHACAVAIRRDFAQRALKFAQSSRIKKARVRALLLG